MSRQIRSSVYSLDDSLSPTDQELFSLFLQYPEIDFGTPNTIASAAIQEQIDHESSPITEKASDDSTLVDDSDSTATLTTPARPSHESDASQSPRAIWNDFVAATEQSDLPEECLEYFRLLGQAIFDLGTELFATARPKKPDTVRPQARWLIKNTTYSSAQAASQVERLTYLKSLVAFNVRPSGPYLWTTYMQRAKLITANLALPCSQELYLVESLALVYDTHAYNDFLHTLGSNIIDEEVIALLNELYHTLMEWLHNYNQWCKGMAELRNNYMRPLIDVFARTPGAQDEFNDFQERIEKAKLALTKPLQSNEELSEEMVKKLNLSARRPGGAPTLKRSRTRYKREHTL